MARYIVLRVESNETASTLLERFAVVPAIKVVGLFASPTQFCDGTCDRAKNDMGVKTHVISRKWGLTFCPECKKPLSSLPHRPRNLLEDPDLHPRFRDLSIQVWEPYDGDPEGKYGADSIQRKKDQVAQGRVRLARHKRKKRRDNGG